MLDTLIDALKLAAAFAAGIGILTLLGSISSKKNNNSRAKSSSNDQQAEESDRADNPYTDDDDFSFREPKWHPPPHRHREEDSDYFR